MAAHPSSLKHLSREPHYRATPVCSWIPEFSIILWARALDFWSSGLRCYRKCHNRVKPETSGLTGGAVARPLLPPQRGLSPGPARRVPAGPSLAGRSGSRSRSPAAVRGARRGWGEVRAGPGRAGPFGGGWRRWGWGERGRGFAGFFAEIRRGLPSARPLLFASLPLPFPAPLRGRPAASPLCAARPRRPARRGLLATSARWARGPPGRCSSLRLCSFGCVLMRCSRASAALTAPLGDPGPA